MLPEKIAEKRHHPQKDAIHTLCLLSLVFGGLLWPIAWLWAYTKPVGYRMAYGTEKHEDYSSRWARRRKAGELLRGRDRAPARRARRDGGEGDAAAEAQDAARGPRRPCPSAAARPARRREAA